MREREREREVRGKAEEEKDGKRRRMELKRDWGGEERLKSKIEEKKKNVLLEVVTCNNQQPVCWVK